MTGFNDLIAASAESVVYEDLRLGAGNTWNVYWTFLDELEDPIDFTGVTAVGNIKNVAGGTVLATWTESLVSGKQIVLGSNGTVSFNATSVATTPLAVTTDYYGVYDIKLTKDAETITLVKGTIKIYRPI